MAAFQVIWFASVHGASNGQPWLGGALLVPFVFWQLATSPDPAYDRRAMAVLSVAGFVIDSSYPLAGILSYAVPWPLQNLAPAWLVLMWVNLALILNHSLSWLRKRYGLAALLGGLGGGISYWAGWRLGAVEIHWPPWAAITLIGLVWTAALPLAYAILEPRSAISSESAPTPR
jgi:hypothetical protein